VNRIFKRGQLVSSAVFSLAHGGNDAQKTMGIIVGLLVSAGPLLSQETGWIRNL
jgi:PiT family inorganic phosphate transporter